MLPTSPMLFRRNGGGVWNDYMLVTADGLEIEDSAGSQGNSCLYTDDILECICLLAS